MITAIKSAAVLAMMALGALLLALLVVAALRGVQKLAARRKPPRWPPGPDRRQPKGPDSGTIRPDRRK